MTKIKKTIINPTQLQLLIVADSSDLAPTKDQLVLDLAQDVKVAGFRTGKAPVALAQKEIDQQLLINRFLERFVPLAVRQACQKAQIRPLIRPKIEVTKFIPFTDLEIEAQILFVANLQLPDWQKWRRPAPSSAVEPTEIDRQIKLIQFRLATNKVVQRPAKLNDRLNFDYWVYDDQQKLLNQLTDQNLFLTKEHLKSHLFDSLLGAKINQKIEVVTTEASRQLKLVFKINQIESSQLPTLNDDFATKVDPRFKSLSDLKEALGQEIKATRAHQLARQQNDQLISDLIKQSKMTLPQPAIDIQVEALTKWHLKNFQDRGIELKDHLERNKISQTDWQNKLRTEAERVLRINAILADIAQTAQIRVNNQEIDRASSALTNSAGSDAVNLDPDRRSMIAHRLLVNKTLAHLRWQVSQPPPTEPPTAATKTKAGSKNQPAPRKKAKRVLKKNK